MSFKGISDSELKKLIEGMKVPIKVSMLSPLDIYVDTATLRQLVRESLHRLEHNRTGDDTETRAVEYAIQQRIDFLAWLHTAKDPEVFMSMYPADEVEDDSLTGLFDRLKEL